MLDKLTSASVKRPLSVFVAVVIITILGVVLYPNLKKETIPGMGLPCLAVATTYQASSAQETQDRITKPLEQAFGGIEGVHSIESTSLQGSSLVVLTLEEDSQIDDAVLKIQEQIMLTEQTLPAQAVPHLLDYNPNEPPVMRAAVLGTAAQEELLPRLQGIEGVAKVVLDGTTQQVASITINPKKIAALHEKLTKDERGEKAAFEIDQLAQSAAIRTALESADFDIPIGKVADEAGQTTVVVAKERPQTLASLKELILAPSPMKGMAPIRLTDLADVTVLEQADGTYAALNGERALMAAFYRKSSISAAAVCRNITQEFDALAQEGIVFETLVDQGAYDVKITDSMLRDLLIGAILAVALLLLFFKRIRLTLLVGVSIAISLVTAFVLLYFSGVTFNVVSMGGFVLATGMLVDNVIVVIENIYRMRGEGKPAQQAAIEGTKQVVGSILSATLTTVAVFAAVLFLEGFSKKLLIDMGLTIAYALLASFLVALTLVPSASALVLGKHRVPSNKLFERIKGLYARVLCFALRYRAATLLLVAALMTGSIFAGMYMPREVPLQTDNKNMTLAVTLASSKQAAEQLDQLGAQLGGVDGVEKAAVVYQPKLDAQKAVCYLKLAQTIPMEPLRELQTETLTLQAQRDPTRAIVLYGEDTQALQAAGEQTAQFLADQPEVAAVEKQPALSPRVCVLVDKSKAAARGLTTAQVYSQLQELLQKEQTVGWITQKGETYPVIVHNPSGSFEQVENLFIKTADGSVRLNEVAAIEQVRDASVIQRRQGEQYICVNFALREGETADGDFAAHLEEFGKTVTGAHSEVGTNSEVRVQVDGEAQALRESFTKVLWIVLFAAVLIYLILVAQYQSLLLPLLVLIMIPLSFTGGLYALLFTSTPLSPNATIGFFVFGGVIVNNGIVLVDYMNQMYKSGINQFDAILIACKDRLRPILMTSWMLIFVLLALCFGTGFFAVGVTFLRPMAMGAIGGLLYATLMTLFVIPVLFDLLHYKKRSTL